ncbi:hypothetical protein [Nostoc sp.]
MCDVQVDLPNLLATPELIYAVLKIFGVEENRQLLDVKGFQAF